MKVPAASFVMTTLREVRRGYDTLNSSTIRSILVNIPKNKTQKSPNVFKQKCVHDLVYSFNNTHVPKETSDSTMGEPNVDTGIYGRCLSNV